MADGQPGSSQQDTSNGDQQIVKAERKQGTNQAEDLKSQLQAMALQQHKQGIKEQYDFWETQPVAQFNEDPSTLPQEDGAIDAPKTVQEVRQEPYPLPDSFHWCQCNINNNDVVKEIYDLLMLNYVEDDDAMFRFKYTHNFLQWALQPPGYKPEWHIGVRVKGNNKLVGFITAVPATICIRGNAKGMVEINFLCVHKKLRSKRLTPLLIKEITRRVNLTDIWQAAYTAGAVLPKPVSTTQYWHRSLNPKKLISVGFSRLQPRMTMARTIKLYKLPDKPKTPGIRPLEKRDVPQVTRLLSTYLEKYSLIPIFTEEEVEHYLMPVEDVVDSYVVESAGGTITDLVSYYTLPSSIIGNDKYDSLKAAFMYYTVATETPLQDLMQDILTLATKKDHDVFNALDIFENTKFLKDLKFGEGDGNLRYYLYNWRVVKDLKPSEVGLVLL
ncbi:hypothetical protein WJX82_007365 [Trebouxia sp. C0006]